MAQLDARTEIWPVVQQRLRAYVGVSWNVQEVSKIFGVSPKTVGDWLATDSPAVGEKLIRLWHYFAAVGYDSPELDNLPAFQRYAGQLLMTSLVTMDELKNYFGVTADQTALQILRGQKPAQANTTLQELQELYNEALRAKLAELPKHDGKTSTQGAAKQTAPAPQPVKEATPRPSKASSSGPADEFLVDAAMKLSAVLPLSRYLNSDHFSPEERSRLRDLIGYDELFDLSNTLGALCGERARNTAK